jgi:uncharacterized membrane protein YhhN
MKKISLTIFAISVLVVLVAEIADLKTLYMISKPLIMISLFAYYFLSVGQEDRSRPVLLAMAFSLVGDILLMNPDDFVLGRVAFLIAHIFYIFAYRQIQFEDADNSLAGLQKMRLAFPIILAGSGLVIILYPVLGAMRIPVMIYALVITVMVLNALFRFGRTPSKSFWMVFLGAALFMISDATIAVNKFLAPVNNAGVIIMSTYCAAQFLIIDGLIRHNEKSRQSTRVI